MDEVILDLWDTFSSFLPTAENSFNNEFVALIVIGFPLKKLLRPAGAMGLSELFMHLWCWYWYLFLGCLKKNPTSIQIGQYLYISASHKWSSVGSGLHCVLTAARVCLVDNSSHCYLESSVAASLL